MRQKNLKLWIVLLLVIGLIKSPAQTIKDIDNNVYETINIGNQTWMKENLKTSRLNDGTSIPLVTDSISWTNLETPGYCWYNNDETSYKNVYGALYNWYTVNSKKLCPIGWHVPADAEWTSLINYLGGSGVAGGKLKEIGTVHWKDPNIGATNETNFTALPGSFRGSYIGKFFPLGVTCNWWTATEFKATHAWYYYIYNDMTYSRKTILDKKHGISVRCIKD